MKIFVAGGTGAIGRPLIAELLAKEHTVVALTRSPEKAQALMEQGVEAAIADIFDDVLRTPDGRNPALRRLRRGADSVYSHSGMLPARSERYELLHIDANTH